MYIFKANPICRTLFKQTNKRACSLGLASVGSNKAARMAMTAMTMSSSMSVKPATAAQRRQDQDRLDRLGVQVFCLFMTLMKRPWPLNLSGTSRVARGICARHFQFASNGGLR